MQRRRWKRFVGGGRALWRLLLQLPRWLQRRRCAVWMGRRRRIFPVERKQRHFVFRFSIGVVDFQTVSRPLMVQQRSFRLETLVAQLEKGNNLSFSKVKKGQEKEKKERKEWRQKKEKEGNSRISVRWSAVPVALM